jgi:hypothetical protein
MTKNTVIGILVLALLGVSVWSYFALHKKSVVTPELPQEITAEYKDLVTVTTPLPGDSITSPLEIKGEARGQWFFEASFPVILTNWDGLIIAQGIATADGDWMTTEFVPFTATLEFTKPEYNERGTLILQKDNPSGLPEHDDAFEFAIRFE